MRRSAFREHRPAFAFNMTPLIDVTFLLLTYFMLASHFASSEQPDMKLPKPDASKATEMRLDDKVTINLLYDEQRGPQYTFGAVQVSGDELADRISNLGRRNPTVQVVLRADRRLSYGQVKQVMKQIELARLARLQVVAEAEGGQSR